MTRRTVALGLGALIVVSATFVMVQTAHAGPESTGASPKGGSNGTPATAQPGTGSSTLQPCTVTNPSIDASGTHATFDVQGHCTVTLVSYELHGKGTLGEQTLYDSTTEEFSCPTPSSTGSAPTAALSTETTPRHPSRTGVASAANGGSCPHDLTVTVPDSTTEEFSCAPTATSSSDGAVASSAESQGRSSTGSCSSTADLTVTVPDCRYQVDLVLGQPRNPPVGYKPGEVLTWRYGGEGECATTTTTTQSVPTTTITPSTPTTSAPPNPTIPPTSVTVANQMVPNSTPVFGGSPTPTELPHTGGGELLPVALGALGLIGAGRLVERRGRRRRARL